jgi:hypothetical protein
LSCVSPFLFVGQRRFSGVPCFFFLSFFISSVFSFDACFFFFFLSLLQFPQVDLHSVTVDVFFIPNPVQLFFNSLKHFGN